MALPVFVGAVGVVKLLTTVDYQPGDLMGYLVIPVGVTAVVTGLMFPNKRFYDVVGREARIPMTSADSSELVELVNVGRAVAGHFDRIGITTIAQLAGQDPVELYEQMSAAAGERLDPCLLDTVMSAVDQADGLPGKPWWHYTAHRKALLAKRSR